MKDKIVILMATYNGERYLRQQLDSIINQTYSNWELWIRDDFSTDKTAQIIATYISMDKRINLYSDNLKNLGCVKNFATLLENIMFDEYIMFCDQDDVWLPFKIEMTLKTMKQQENLFKGPTLIYSPYQLVDDKLNNIKVKSYNLPKKIKINNILTQNFIYGCTMMLNKELVKLANPISDQAENHDYWIALIAAYHGKIASVEKPTILYRQHDNNVSGHYKNGSIKLRLSRFLNGNYETILATRILMICNLVIHLKNKNKETDFLEQYVHYIGSGGITAVYFILSNKLFKYGTGLNSNIMNLIAVFNFRNKI